MHLRLFYLALIFVFAVTACRKELPVPAPDYSETWQKNLVATAEKEIAAAQHQELQFRWNAKTIIPHDAVELPAGSVNGLAAAIAEAGENGAVLVKAGEHIETGTVIINHPVSIIGEAGAVIISSTRPIEEIGYLQSALHVLNTSDVVISGLDLRADSDWGGSGIFLENAPASYINRNRLTNFSLSIVNHHGDHSYISHNTITGSSEWLSNFNVNVMGIMNINGDRVRIFNNVVSNNVFGIWPCDEKGMASGNTTNGNFIGLILCKVPLQIPLQDGTIIGSENPSQDWTVLHNRADNNFHVGIIAIDGANNNLILMNKAAGNVDADVELAGDSQRFGFLTPTSYENTLISAKGIRVKDCGIDNSVHGGSLIDTALNPCY